MADVTGDGKPDVVTYGFDAHTLDLLVGHGDGTLAPRVEFGGAATPAAIVVADVTGDGRPDILLSGGSLFTTVCLP
ncbi:MAG TPA: VCBS repeat-containing protein [Kofleriaceae bacterium]